MLTKLSTLSWVICRQVFCDYVHLNAPSEVRDRASQDRGCQTNCLLPSFIGDILAGSKICTNCVSFIIQRGERLITSFLSCMHIGIHLAKGSRPGPCSRIM